MLKKLTIYLATFPAADTEKCRLQASQMITQSLSNDQFEFVDHDPDLLFFLTGGSEAAAIKMLEDAPKRFRIFIGNENENGYAAATETMAKANELGMKNKLLTYRNAVLQNSLTRLYESKKAIEKIRGKKILLIGNISDWLIASNTSAEQLQAKFGIKLIQDKWPETKELEAIPIDDKMLQHFNLSDANQVLKDASRLNSFIKNKIDEHKADAVTTECFPLIKQFNTTACLGLSYLNDLNIPSGCEGDIVSITGMLILKYLCGSNPWMANINSFKRQNVMFSHCTVPLNMLESYRLDTHFESDKGAAVRGKFKKSEVTVFRFSKDLNQYFVAHGDIVRRNDLDTACRTQISIELRTDKQRLLQRKPLGNHHLILPGNHEQSIRIFCALNNIKAVDEDR